MLLWTKKREAWPMVQKSMERLKGENKEKTPFIVKVKGIGVFVNAVPVVWKIWERGDW